MNTTPAKAVVAAVGTFITVLISVFADNVLNADEWTSIVAGLFTMIVTVVAVYKVPNKKVQ